ncbi:hypothetical protein [Pandoravirus japonicus]|uniref:Uncharacterized protein n=1 Tax=Pandoravirus japonicus TaxID=2823154 RepID=A0A811BTC1_9VIRU|nr:hypothetical protein [Pandoravirus japonicus]
MCLGDHETQPGHRPSQTLCAIECLRAVLANGQNCRLGYPFGFDISLVFDCLSGHLIQGSSHQQTPPTSEKEPSFRDVLFFLFFCLLFK